MCRILCFIAKISSTADGPYELKKQLERTCLNNANYNLRSNSKLIIVRQKVNTKFGDFIFKNMCSKLVDKLEIIDIYGDLKSFKTCLYNNQNEILNIFIKIFPNFCLNKLNIFYRFKKT